jgi:hypothetical protein
MPGEVAMGYPKKHRGRRKQGSKRRRMNRKRHHRH